MKTDGRIPHAFERPVDPKKLRAEGAKWLTCIGKTSWPWKAQGEGGSMYHALERSVDLKKLRVEGGRIMNHALEFKYSWIIQIQFS